MALNNCENVWRVVNDGVETMFIICIRPFIPINYSNNSFNASNFTNSSDIRSNISDINNTFVVLDNSPSSTNHFSIYSPSSLDPLTPSSIIPSPVSNISPSSIISELVNHLFPSSSPNIELSSSFNLTPSVVPSVVPSIVPSIAPNIAPSAAPNIAPSAAPSVVPSIMPSIAPSFVPSVAQSFVPSVVPSIVPSTSSNFDDGDTIINENQEIIKNISNFLNNSFNLTSNFSLSNHTKPFITKNKDTLILVLSILIPLWFAFSSLTLYLYCKKRKSGTVIPCQTSSKKKDQFTRPKDYLLEIIPNADIPDVEKPPPSVPPRPGLMMLKESIDEDEEKEVEVINVAYGVTEKKNDD